MADDNDTETSDRQTHPGQDDAGWRAVVAEVMPGEPLRGIRRFGGGTTAETFCLATADGEVVVKRYRRSRPHAARAEWERLCFAQRVDAPVPQPIAIDDEGRWFGKPALAMTRLIGQVDVRPSNVDAWLQQLATSVAAIHRTDTSGAPGQLLSHSAFQTWRPPTFRRPDPLAERATAVIGRHLPDLTWQPVLTHGDFHPGNTLWQDGVLTGIADWATAGLGPAASELAYCRADIAIHLGQEPADRLTRYYARTIGRVPAQLAVFDLFWGLDAHRKSARILNAHRAQGCATTPTEFAARTTNFIRSALSQLDSS